MRFTRPQVRPCSEVQVLAESSLTSIIAGHPLSGFVDCSQESYKPPAALGEGEEGMDGDKFARLCMFQLFEVGAQANITLCVIA
jgi:hypothetical protein